MALGGRDIILYGEKIKVTLLKSEMRQRCIFSTLLFNMVIEALAREVRQGKKIKGIQIGKGEV